eukprot:6195804-Pleurochrysis_carterae.AAC.1
MSNPRLSSPLTDCMVFKKGIAPAKGPEEACMLHTAWGCQRARPRSSRRHRQPCCLLSHRGET